jgi:O-antigen ligase
VTESTPQSGQPAPGRERNRRSGSNRPNKTVLKPSHARQGSVEQVSSELDWGAPKSPHRRWHLGEVSGSVTLFGWIALIILLIGDAISGQVSASTSLSALVTTLLVVVALVVLYPTWLFSRKPEVSSCLLPLLIFLVWAGLVTAAFHHFDKEGLQNLAVYVLFFSTIAIVEFRAQSGSGARFGELLIIVGWLRVALYGVVLYFEGLNNSAGIYSRRDFAIEALLIMSVVMMSQDARRRVRWLPYVLAAEIALSESRTATAIAAVLLVVVAVRGRSGARAVVSVLGRIAVVVLIGLWAIESIPSLHDRVFGNSQTQLLGGVELNTSGRNVIWSGIVADADSHNVWVGQGAGSATDYVRNVEGITGGEPHDDYLRIWHDFGYVGLLMWSVALLTLLRAMWIRGKRTGNPMCFAGMLSLISILGLMLTSNVIVYFFAMLPLGAIIGFALGEPSGQRESDAVSG